MNQSTMGEGINCSILRGKEGERISAPTRVIPAALKQFKLFSVLICACLTFLMLCAQNQWRTRVTASPTLLVPPPCTDTWTAIISRWIPWLHYVDSGQMIYTDGRCSLFCCTFYYFVSQSFSPTDTHMHVLTHLYTHSRAHVRTTDLGLISICWHFEWIGKWAPLKAVSALTRELSLPAGWSTVTGLSLALHWLTVADKHDLTGKHNVNTHRCQCTSKGHFVDETLNSLSDTFNPFPFSLPEESSQLFSFWRWGCPLKTPGGARGGLTGSSVYM